MFSISQTSSGVFCLEWSSTEDGPKVVSSNHLKLKSSFSNLSLLEEIVSNYKLITNNESNSLSVVVNSDNVIISSIEVDSIEESSKFINWYELNIMGKKYCQNYLNYYFPMFSKNKYLIVSFPKKIKDNIVQSASNLGFNLVNLSVDIFSAGILLQHLYKKCLKGSYLLWKICKNNKHKLILYNGMFISAYVVIKKSSNKYVKSFGLGEDNEIVKLIDCVNNYLIHKKSNSNILNIYIYQTKDNHSMINDIVKIDSNNIKILSIDQLVDKGEYNKLKYMKFVENGICFKGLDL